MARPRYIHSLRVAYIDTDAASVVHHATYLRYFEVARIEFLRSIGWDYAKWSKDSNLGLPVAENTVRYLAPAFFDDALEIETWTSSARRSSIIFQYNLRRGDKLLTQGHTKCACTTMQGQLRRMPEDLLRICLGDEFSPTII